ncbi:MAG: hypothetical protein PHY27_11735, partial [Parabacteroides sp.]|nr:hypothetical protein [Parabacteroides sp.]
NLQQHLRRIIRPVAAPKPDSPQTHQQRQCIPGEGKVKDISSKVKDIGSKVKDIPQKVKDISGNKGDIILINNVLHKLVKDVKDIFVNFY